jgi:hyperosmotically inducible periplasmic protein
VDCFLKQGDNPMKTRITGAIAIVLLCLVSSAQGTVLVVSQKQTPSEPKLSPSRQEAGHSSALMAEEIRRQLITLPYYGVFDWLEAQVQPDGTVTLRGAVTRPTTKSAAEARIRRLESVTNVVNEIEELPPSPSDDRIRVAMYRAIFSWDRPLFRYATRAVPPIHIIVRNGRATLKGFVASEMDRQLAYTAARGVPGVFEVNNELMVDQENY